jgi:phage/plasmid-like protein (TIGR03299 family)
MLVYSYEKGEIYIMAHELEIVNGEAQMAYAGDVPWHGLGTKVSPDLTPNQMMVAAGLDWEVKPYTSFIEVKNDEGKVRRLRTGHKSLVRMSDNKVLTNIGPNWNPVQNEQAFDFFHEFVLAGDMEMHTAGSLKGGQIVWALAKVKESFDIFGGDQVDSYLLFSNPHIYGKSIDIRFTPIRVVCNNTLSFALNTTSNVQAKVGHRVPFDATKVKETMGLAHEKFDEYRQMAEFLGSKRVSGDDLIAYFSQVFPKSGEKKADPKDNMSRNAKIALDVMDKQPGAEFAPGSYWQAFNAVTYLTDHIQGRNADNRLQSAWYGSNQARKIKAANLAMDMANAA